MKNKLILLCIGGLATAVPGILPEKAAMSWRFSAAQAVSVLKVLSASGPGRIHAAQTLFSPAAGQFVGGFFLS